MKANFTRNLRSFLLTGFASIAAFTISLQEASAQKWSGVHGNEWLEDKYDQPWVRVGVVTKGIQRVQVSDLPGTFKASYAAADKKKVALFHRGNEVAIIKADANEILFYGVPNDGATDAWLYRLPVSRRNPYFSIYSDEGAYFLTVNAAGDGLRAETPAVSVNPGAENVTSHKKKSVRIYKNEFSHSTAVVYRPAYLNSYFEDGKQTTGTALYAEYGPLTYTRNRTSELYNLTYVPEPFSFVVRGYTGTGDRKVTVYLKGRSGVTRASILAGPDEVLSNLEGKGDLVTSNYNDYSFTFNLANRDLNSSTGEGFLGFKSDKLGAEGSAYSVSYFTVEYDQLTDAFNETSEFVFPAGTSGVQSKITIQNPPSGAQYYDITNADRPKVLTQSSGSLYIDRDGSGLNILASGSGSVSTIASSKMKEAAFSEIDPSDYDYLIVNSPSLSASADAFATYRKSTTPGRKFKPLVKNVTDIYNQFNYGEPSPVAIRRFVDYMISDGNKDKYLLLIGKSTTYYENSVREIPDEVPTVGYPGSDVLLTDGLAGTDDDVPAIPVGRISAISDQQVLAYLSKVDKYEKQTNLSWRKKVIHMNGGKSTGEVTLFKNYMTAIASTVTASPFSGTVIPKVKTQEADVIEEVSLASDINSGVGMISYFGHGNYNKTDYNAGYATDASKNYNNTENFPVLFYNGCGVNNVFTGLNGNYGETNVRSLSVDWLLAASKGAIAVFGNTWDAYAQNSNEYLDRLYPHIFGVNDKNRKSIGNILKDVAQEVKTAKGYTYSAGQNGRVQAGYYDVDRANVHQILLQGDPALIVLTTAGPLPVSLVSFEAKAEQDQVNLFWKTASEKNNGHFIIERSYNGKQFEQIGLVEGKGTTDLETTYSFVDSKPLSGTSYYRLKQVDAPSTVGGNIVEGATTDSRIVSVTRNEANFFVVSPNPTSDFIDLKLDAPVKVVSWSILDVQGRIQKKGEKTTNINLAGLPSGTYVVEAITANGDSYKKTIIKK